MTAETTPELKERLVIPVATSKYPYLCVTYGHNEYSIDTSKNLTKKGKNYYDSKAEIPEGFRISTASEELCLQLMYEKGAKIIKNLIATNQDKDLIKYFVDNGELILDLDPRKAKFFDDLFARGSDKEYLWQWTETGLRVPKGREASKYETDAQGRKYWARIVLDGDKEVGEILVPEGGGRLAAEWDEVFGVPRVTVENQDFPHKSYTTHFWFNATPNIDGTSGHYDVAVGRRGDWLHDGRVSCLSVNADFGRSVADSGDGFRLVRGSLGSKLRKNSQKLI